MAGSSNRRRGGGGLDAWPGYVDALSTLLMVIIFVLLVFVLAQGFLSVALSTRDRALDRLNRQVAELAELLALERGQAEELRGGLARASGELASAAAARDDALRGLALLRDERDRLAAERDSARSEQERLAARLADLGVGARGTEERVATLERQLAEAMARAERVGGDAARTTRDLTDTRRNLDALRAEAAALNQQVQALTALRDELERRAQAALARAGEEERARRTAEQDAASRAAEAAAAQRRREAAEGLAAAATARAGASEAESRAAQQRAAAAEAAARDAVARAATAEQSRQRAEDIARQAAAVQASAERARAEAERDAAARIAAAERARAEADALRAEAATRAGGAETRAAEQTRLADSARAQVALLTRQIESLRAELARIITALELEEAAGRDREAQIALLGQRLNAALAARVEELQRFRSDFFGRLRQVLGERPEVRIVGDRFVFQGEVLFAPASADLSEAGRAQVRDLARVLLEVTPQIPAEIAWVVRVDGHADRSPIRSARFASNWELAAARAIAVAQLLIAEGLPANRVAATSFGDTQPIEAGENPAAYARNRRIELRLTDR